MLPGILGLLSTVGGGLDWLALGAGYCGAFAAEDPQSISAATASSPAPPALADAESAVADCSLMRLTHHDEVSWQTVSKCMKNLRI